MEENKFVNLWNKAYFYFDDDISYKILTRANSTAVIENNQIVYLDR